METSPPCPHCGEANLPGATPQIELIGEGEWLCNTCAKIFLVCRELIDLRSPRTRPQGDGDDGQRDDDVELGVIN